MTDNVCLPVELMRVVFFVIAGILFFAAFTKEK
jgi:hypothetical protein